MLDKDLTQFIGDKVDQIIVAPSACAELQQAATAWQDAIGTPEEAEQTRRLLDELAQDVNTIDDTIAFLSSDRAREMMGETTAANMLERAQEHKDHGGKTCFCDACMAGQEILDRRDQILAAL